MKNHNKYFWSNLDQNKNNHFRILLNNMRYPIYVNILEVKILVLIKSLNR